MQKYKVLVVDDELFMRTLVGDWVTSWGHEPTLVSNGAEAVELVEKNKFDIIVLDYVMPDMDGLKTLKLIRKIDQKVSVVMFTGHPTEEFIEETKKLGISAYVTKLNDASEIQHVLKSVFSLMSRKNI
jgi:CheY-like chemotaxis protein